MDGNTNLIMKNKCSRKSNFISMFVWRGFTRSFNVFIKVICNKFKCHSLMVNNYLLLWIRISIFRLMFLTLPYFIISLNYCILHWQEWWDTSRVIIVLYERRNCRFIQISYFSNRVYVPLYQNGWMPIVYKYDKYIRLITLSSTSL